MGAVAEEVTHESPSRAEMDTRAQASADTYVAHLDERRARRGGRRHDEAMNEAGATRVLSWRAWPTNETSHPR
jgi:hypothetical protein